MQTTYEVINGVLYEVVKTPLGTEAEISAEIDALNADKTTITAAAEIAKTTATTTINEKKTADLAAKDQLIAKKSNLLSKFE